MSARLCAALGKFERPGLEGADDKGRYRAPSLLVALSTVDALRDGLYTFD